MSNINQGASVNWKTVELGTVCDFQNGFAFKSNTFVEDGLPILRISNIQNQKIDTNNLAYFNLDDYKENLEKYKVYPNDLLIAMSGATTGKIGFNNTDDVFYLNQRVGNLKPKPTLDKKYLYYFLSTQVEKNLSISAGAAQPNLSTEQIKSLEIPFPALPIQKEISKKLDIIFTEIEKVSLAIDANSKNSERLFQSYLTEIFEYGKSEWENDTIGNLCTLRSGTTVDAKLEKPEGEIPYLKVADMNLPMNRELVLTSSRFLNLTDVGKNSIIKRGSTIFPKRGGAIDTNKKRLVGADIAVDLNIMSVFPRDSLNPNLLFFYFLYVDMKKLGSGSSIRQINNYDIEPLTINFPKANKEQDKLVTMLTNLKLESEKLSANYKMKKLALIKLKQSILQQAFHGELIRE